ncbi:MAG: oligosaccharide flippase family protein [Chlorobiales bacterium]|nr:oligosaccharide flippase family protein [Chlorobiales bacterium]
MLSKLKHLAKDTAIYGASTILARGLNYVLVPLYANLLSTEDNGIQALIYANIALANVLFTYGMETAYMKFSADAAAEKKELGIYFSTAFLSLFVSSLMFAAVAGLFAAPIATLMGLQESSAIFIRYSAIILLLDTLAVVPFAELRLQHKAVRFAAVRLTSVLMVVISTVILVMGFDMGLHGAFWGNIIGSGVALLLQLPSIFSFKPIFSKPLWKEMLRLALPYAPTGLLGILSRLIDRNVLIRLPEENIRQIYGKDMSSTDIVGIYGRVVAFGILVQLLIQVFRFAWQPFFLQHSKDSDSKPLFSRVLTLSTLAILLIALGASFFVSDIIQYKFFNRFYLLPPAFWIGLPILPIVFMSFVFEVLATNLSAGILIQKKTAYLPMISGGGAVVTIFLCLQMTPTMGMMGAAIATTLGTAAIAAGMYVASIKFYPNQYEWGKLVPLFLASVLLYLGSDYFAWGTLGKAALFTGFLLLVGFLFRQEAKSVLARLKKR